MVVKDNNMAIAKPKRGPTPIYDVGADEVIITADKVISFKNTVYKYNKTKGTSYKYGFAYKTNSNKVTATRIA